MYTIQICNSIKACQLVKKDQKNFNIFKIQLKNFLRNNYK